MSVAAAAKPCADDPAAAAVADDGAAAHSRLTTRQWRALLLTIAAGCAIYLAVAASGLERAYDPSVGGSLGARLQARDSNGLNLIRQLEPGSPLALAGAKVGDRVRLDHQSDRWR